MFLSFLGKLLPLVFLGGGATVACCKAYDKQCCPTTTVIASDSGSYEYSGFTDSGGHMIFGFELSPAESPTCPFAKSA